MAKNFRGFVEKCDSTIGLCGWFLDRDEPDLSIQVDIFVDGNLLCQAPADVFRQDLLDKGLGNGKHGFRIAVPDKFFDDTKHIFSLGADGIVVPSSAKVFLLPHKTFVPIILGNVDNCDDKGIRGWIVYENDLQQVVSIDVVIDDELIVTTEANLFRKDLTNFRDGNCAFNVPIPDKFWDGVEHRVGVYDAATKNILIGTKTFLIGSKFVGNIESCDENGIVGWILDEKHPQKPVVVDVFIDDELVAQVTANLFRQDLLDVKLGNGNYGFSVAIPNKFLDGVEHRVKVQEAVTTTVLQGSPKFKVQKVSREVEYKNLIIAFGYEQDKRQERVNIKYSNADIELIRSSEYFDAQWYMHNYCADRLLIGTFDPVIDFLDRCLNELQNPGPNFDTKYYIETYPDIKKNKLLPLLHFLKAGKKEGRKVKPPLAKEIPDENGNLRIPNRRLGNQKQFKSLSFNREHYWYSDRSVEEYLIATKSQESLPSSLRHLLVIAHDFKLSTGVSRPISHYLNAMCQLGGYELTSIELAKGAEGKSVAIDIDAHDFVIINSYAPFINNPGLLNIAAKTAASNPGKLAIYLHETDWGFDNFESDYPDLYKEFCDCAKLFAFLLVSNMQAEIIKRRFRASRCYVVYNTTKIESVAQIKSKLAINKFIESKNCLRIVMSGTLQPRKGANLFSDVADYAKNNGLNWEFIWAGSEEDKSVRHSDNVKYVGHLDHKNLASLLESSDLFFLSSVDDPFPLSVLEAMQLKKRVVVFKNCGISEVIQGISGAAIYATHDVQAAITSIKKALAEIIDLKKYAEINEMLGLRPFIDRMNAAISNIHGNIPAPKRYPNKKIAVHLHLYYLDLWLEMKSYLNNLYGLNADIYITISQDTPRDQVTSISSKITASFPNAIIINCENRGMDVGPFIEVLSYITKSSKSYNYLLKIHTKKSMHASGEEKGAEWRRDLLDGLIGTPTTVDRILSLFESDQSIGMIGPRNMIISKTTKDVKLGMNANLHNMQLLADKLGLTIKDDQCFVRGTMFWSRFNEIAKPIADSALSIKDFESGHQLDESKAHAMERLLPAIVEQKGLYLHAFDKELPRSIAGLKGRHEGEDIYIIAAGASCDYIDPSFFDGKVVVGVNRVFRKFRCDYVVMKEYGGAVWIEEIEKSKAIPIISKWDSGNIKQAKQRLNSDYFHNPQCYYYDHLENTREVVDLSVIGDDTGKLVVSYSSITTAMHLAAWLGAKNILLVGHDCGTLDNKETFDGYNDANTITPWKEPGEYRAWLGKIESQTVVVRNQIRSKYALNVYSLNPFVNFGLEDHLYCK